MSRISGHINSTLIPGAKNLANETNIAIAAYKEKEKAEIKISKQRFEENKTDEMCVIESAKLRIPCECPEGQRLLRVDWKKKPIEETVYASTTTGTP